MYYKEIEYIYLYAYMFKDIHIDKYIGIFQKLLLSRILKQIYSSALLFLFIFIFSLVGIFKCTSIVHLNLFDPL